MSEIEQDQGERPKSDDVFPPESGPPDPNADTQFASVSEGTPSSAEGASTDPPDEGAKPVDGALLPGSAGERGELALIPKGNPLRRKRGGITVGVGALGAFLLMSQSTQLRLGIPLGLLFVLVLAFGVMDLLGTFDDADDRVASHVTLQSLMRPLGSMAGAGLSFCAALALAARGGLLPPWGWGLLVTATFVAFAASMFQLGVKLGPFALDEAGQPRPLLERHGFWLVAIAAGLYFPFMGNFSLWDPWETHYGEVAREILTRDDWISLWWAQDGWFWSKPILNFWMQALAMASLGVHYKPDLMLVGSGRFPVHQPEWVVRAPVVLLTILAMYILYKGVAKAFGRRAGLLGGIVLATMPDWFFLAHQTMTDMPFVAAMTAAMGLLLLGLHADDQARARVYEVRTGGAAFRFSAWHLVFGAILVCALPQILYLFSRNLELVVSGSGAKGFRPHLDEFRSGSGGGNCGLPGNEACAAATPAIHHGAAPQGASGWLVRILGFEPFVQGLLWIGVLGTLLRLNWGERRIRRLCHLAAWFFAAIATMGKGPAGFILPMLCAFVYVCAAREEDDVLTRIRRIVKDITRFELVSGLLIILAVALPWYVAMYVRHGSQFTDRLIFHDMFNRAFHHVHDTNEGDDTSFRYYLWQLGYAFFPWTGLVPLGLVHWLKRVSGEDDVAGQNRRDTSVLLVMWFLFAFALFSFMGTKFHHYIFPAVPPAAMLTGIVLHKMMGERQLASSGNTLAYVAGMAGGATLCVLGVARFLPGSILGARGVRGELLPASPVVGSVLLLAGIALWVGFATYFRGKGDASDKSANLDRLLFGAGAVGAAAVLVLVGRDLGLKGEGAEQPGAIRLLQLFTYNYKRGWPDSLDFSAVLFAFAAVGIALCLGMGVAAIRHHAVSAFAGLSVVWGLWGTDVYMVKTAPHWGQREVIAAYYERRASPDEQLVAYQMNWKGENFYTGNKIPAFVSSGSTFTQWLKKQRDAGQKVMFFVTEHGRVGSLKSEVSGKAYQEITDKAVCNKFVLVRAEL